MPVHPHIPDRIEEGYGLNMDAITSLQRADDITLIITVDCGITAIDENNHALQRGIDMVITDHHECSGRRSQTPWRCGSEAPWLALPEQRACGCRCGL
ncbi:MAG: DHH family phosphoesterase [Oscillospiraceae bacterium]